jgi:hypothetical protein
VEWEAKGSLRQVRWWWWLLPLRVLLEARRQQAGGGGGWRAERICFRGEMVKWCECGAAVFHHDSDR